MIFFTVLFSQQNKKMQNIKYEDCTLPELNQLCKIRLVTSKAKTKPGLIKALEKRDNETKGYLVCGVCKQYCETSMESCGCICHPTCTAFNDEGFFICGVCGLQTIMTAPSLELIYAKQQSQHEKQPLHQEYF
jgi:hypothetical protein